MIGTVACAAPVYLLIAAWIGSALADQGAAICSKAGLLTVITLELRWFGSNRAPVLVLIDRQLN